MKINRRLENAIGRALAAAADNQAFPEHWFVEALHRDGFVIVPREPIEAMTRAYTERHCDPHGTTLAIAVWRAMIERWLAENAD
jgi:hypothetical protein